MGKWAKVAAKNGVELPVAAPVAAPKETKEEKKARLQEEKRKQKAAKKRAKLYARDPAEEEMEATIAQLENGPTKFAMQVGLDFVRLCGADCSVACRPSSISSLPGTRRNATRKR